MSKTYPKYPGQPVCVFDYKTENRKRNFDFDKNVLEEILLQDEVVGRSVSVLSIMGGARSGKSFLLDYFLRFMYATYRSTGSPKKPFREGLSDSWLGDAEESLEGFSWTCGSERDTTGIVFWNDVFLHDAENGEKIAIILMDSQGIFDNKSSHIFNSRVFAASTLISSMQVFNLSGHIQGDHLEFLKFSTEKAQLGLTMKSDAPKPFQDLMFLIRDWPNPDEFAYGLSDGSAYLDEILAVDGIPEETAQTKRFIEASFDLSCFLLPHPGKVATTTKSYNGSWSQMSEEFKEHLLDLTETLLSPKNLVLKKFNNQNMTCQELFTSIISFVELYKKMLNAPITSKDEIELEMWNSKIALERISKKQLQLAFKLENAKLEEKIAYKNYLNWFYRFLQED